MTISPTAADVHGMLAGIGSNSSSMNFNSVCSLSSVRDCFKPSAVYQDTNNGAIALEGTLHKDLPYPGGCWPDQDKKRARIRGYLILPGPYGRKEIVSADELWLKDSDFFWPKGIAADLQDHLPSGYAKVRELENPSHRTLLIAGSEKHPHLGLMAFAPLTFTVDVATSPLQLLVGVIFILNGPW